MCEVTLQQVLASRDERAATQKQLIETHGCPLICFTMNIAGPVKTSPLIERGFYKGVKMLNNALLEEDIVFCSIKTDAVGPVAFYAVNADAKILKQKCTHIEEATPLGRLFDMDVINTDFVKLSRSGLRGCIVCGKPGRECAAGRLHTVEQLQQATSRILTEHFENADSLAIGNLAADSLAKEVYTTPKPGLVDRRNSGSHTDMDLAAFLDSANALRPYYTGCARIGMQHQNTPEAEVFALLRKEGLKAEQTMLAATGGVNTHKGAIYTLGLLCAAAGMLWRPIETGYDPKALADKCTALVKESVLADFANAQDNTAGMQLYRQHGLTGIRGEVAGGLCSVIDIALPAYQNALQKGHSDNDAGVIALIHLIASVQDTNLYRRGGKEGAAFAADYAKTLLSLPDFSTTDVKKMDDEFIKQNLSPGGCADLLAAVYFLHGLTRNN